MATSYLPRRAAGFAGGLLAALAFQTMSDPLDARQAAGSGPCRISGRATSSTTPLPGVAIALKSGDAVRATSTEADGGYAINLASGQYILSAELTGFTRVQRPLVVVADGASPSAGATGDRCSQTVDLALALAPRQPPSAAARAPQRGAAGQAIAVQVQPQGAWAGPADVLLLRGLRSRIRGERPRRPHQPRVLSRQGEGI